MTAAARRARARIESAWLGLPANARGALWVTAGTMVFAFNETDTLVKALGGTIHPIEMAFFRYCVGALLLVPVFWRAGFGAMSTRRLPLLIGRGVLAGIGQAGAFYAVVHLLLADATAIQFSRPLFMTLLAVFILGEAVGWRRWAATAIGFGGVIVMVRQLTGVGCFVAPAIWVWRTPVAEEWLLRVAIGVCTTAAMVCYVRGLAAGEASIVAPMEYTRLIYAAFLGYFLFAEVPVIWTWIGAAIIVGSALYIARREAFARPS